MYHIKLFRSTSGQQWKPREEGDGNVDLFFPVKGGEDADYLGYLGIMECYSAVLVFPNGHLQISPARDTGDLCAWDIESHGITSFVLSLGGILSLDLMPIRILHGLLAGEEPDVWLVGGDDD